MYGGPPGGGPPPPPPYHYGHQQPPQPYDPYQAAPPPPQQHYYGAPPPPPHYGYSYAAAAPPPPPPPPASHSNAGEDEEYDPFAVVGAAAAPSIAEAPPPPPPPPPPIDRKQEDDALRDMEAKLQAEKEAHAKRVAAERMRQHQTAPGRKAVPTVAMRGRPVGALKRKAGSSAASVFSRGDSSDEEGSGPAGGEAKQGSAAAAAASSSAAEAVAEEAELTEGAKAAIRRVAEGLVAGGKGQEAREAALLVRARADPALSFLLPPPPGGKPSAAHAFFLGVKEELRVKEQVRRVSMGIGDNNNNNNNSSKIHTSTFNDNKYGPARAVAPPAPAPAPQEPPQKKKRNRWGPAPGEEPAKPGLGATTPAAPPPLDAVVAAVAAAVAAEAPGVKNVKKAFLPTVMDEAAARQLREQKKMQLLEQRIREAARAQLAGAKDAKAREVALFEERRRQYEELAEKDDKEFRDTMAMAEQTGGVIEGGTWEHRKRAKEMLKTADTALELTLVNKGKHHIADYLPEEELEKFLTNADAAVAGEKDALAAAEDYEQHKLDADSHLGMQMLKRQGWEEGSGLGKEGKEGVAAPVNARKPAGEAAGIGVAPSHEVEEGDDAFDQYRKRMMLAYRFRPNPMNNPRRAYY